MSRKRMTAIAAVGVGASALALALTPANPAFATTCSASGAVCTWSGTNEYGTQTNTTTFGTDSCTSIPAALSVYNNYGDTISLYWWNVDEYDQITVLGAGGSSTSLAHASTLVCSGETGLSHNHNEILLDS
ncbi:hypothetical protein [Streptomyces sp. NPDC002952]|uniref:hypothetical protein n=1 Tax=Streptomyces sp. NPDC002952 TaxID=3364673 RepID=UPI0036AA06BC